MSDEIIKHSTLSAIVDTWEVTKARVEQAYENMETVKATLKSVFGDDFNPPEFVHRTKETYLDELRREVWEQIIYKSEIPKYMSIKASDKLKRDLAHDKPQEITIENVLALVKSGVANIQNMADEMVYEVFDILRPHMTGYKNNEKFAGELGSKVVLSWWISDSWGKWSSKPSINYHRQHEVRAIQRVFVALDGKGFDNSGSYWGELYDAIENSTGKGETEYFRFTCYKNGNLHLEFKRMDLVRKMNAIASRNILRKNVA